MADKCISYGKVANMITPISNTYANVVSTPVSANYPLLQRLFLFSFSHSIYSVLLNYIYNNNFQL